MADCMLVQLLVNLQYPGNGANPGQNAVLLGQDGGSGALVQLNAGARSRIASGFVLQQCMLQNGAESAAVPIHRVYSFELSSTSLRTYPSTPAICLFSDVGQFFKIGTSH